MDLQARITWWLDNDGGFADGVQLYQEAGLKEHLPSFKSAVQQSFVTPNVYDRLRASIMVLEAKAKKSKKRKKKPLTTDEPSEVLSLRKRGIALKRRESDIHGQMKALVATGNPAVYQEQLHGLAREMMEEIQPGLDETYDAIRAWESDGKLPVLGKQQIIQETVQKMRHYENLRKRISKLKGMLRKDPTDEERSRYEQELKDKENEMEDIREELQL